MKRKWIFVFILVAAALLFALYDTYPKWIIISKEKKISQIPAQWKKLSLGLKRKNLFHFWINQVMSVLCGGLTKKIFGYNMTDRVGID